MRRIQNILPLTLNVLFFFWSVDLSNLLEPLIQVILLWIIGFEGLIYIFFSSLIKRNYQLPNAPCLKHCSPALLSLMIRSHLLIVPLDCTKAIFNLRRLLLTVIVLIKIWCILDKSVPQSNCCPPSVQLMSPQGPEILMFVQKRMLFLILLASFTCINELVNPLDKKEQY